MTLERFRLRRTLSAAVISTMLGCLPSAGNAADVVISSGDVAATIADAGWFSRAAPGLSYRGIEFVNAGYFLSWYWLNAGGKPYSADEGLETNPLFGQAAGTGPSSASVTGGNASLSFSQAFSIPSVDRLLVSVTLTNTSALSIDQVQWGVGFDPDQDDRLGTAFTINRILGAGAQAAVRAIGVRSGYEVVLENIAGGLSTVAAYIDPSNCCTTVDPAIALAAAQATGFEYRYDSAISLAYDIGTLAAGEAVTFSYAYTFAAPVPEPQTYALWASALGVIGAMVHRRRRRAAVSGPAGRA
jgi:hypothetical protein